jgi:type IV pilus assembly protein PilW
MNMADQMTNSAVRSQHRRQRGVTLIELMVAVLLATLLTAGAIQVFIGSRATYAFNEGLARLQENARFALDQIANEARMAGYVGCLSNLGVNNALDPPNAFRDDLEAGLQGFDAVGTLEGAAYVAGAMNPAPSVNENAWAPPLPDPELADRVIPGSDVLVVRHVGAQANTLISPFSEPDEVYTTQPDNEFAQGQVLVVTDCQKATIFQVTNNPAAGATLRHASGGGFTPGNLVSDWPTEQLYGLGSEVAPLETVAFFVGRGANGVPALFQQRLRRINATTTDFAPPEELVDSIDTMQLRYGHDADEDGTVDDWLTADAVDAADDWDEVVSVEVSLVARAAEEYGTDVDVGIYPLAGMTFDPFNDRRLRRVFSTVVSLRNRLP